MNFIQLSFIVFDNQTSDFEQAIRWRLKNMPELKIFIAEQDGKIIGYKGGYAIDHDKYYSWLGVFTLILENKILVKN